MREPFASGSNDADLHAKLQSSWNVYLDTHTTSGAFEIPEMIVYEEIVTLRHICFTFPFYICRAASHENILD